MSFIVAIDGPAGTGKGTITKLIAKDFGLINIDTGATYRCVTLEMINQNISINEKDKIIKISETIKIDIKEYEDKIEIVFKNKGDKIPEYKLEKIFDKFYRADESRTSSTGGAGLGLAITKQIIELHNGKIYAKNDNEFIEFYIELSK